MISENVYDVPPGVPCYPRARFIQSPRFFYNFETSISSMLQYAGSEALTQDHGT